MRTQRKRGVIFLTSIVALAVMFIIGVSFISVASQQFNDSRRDLDSLHAIAMADAGVRYLIWRQRYSTSPISPGAILASSTDIKALSRNGSPAPHVTLQIPGYGEDEAAVWVMHAVVPGTSTGYQVISKGYYRKYDRAIRAILQGTITLVLPPGEPIPFPQLNYAAYTAMDLTIGTSINVNGPIGSNGNITLNNNPSAGVVNGDIYAASGVILGSSQAYANGDVSYGTGIFQQQGRRIRDITGSASSYFSGSITGGATTQVIPPIIRDGYEEWASLYGADGVFNGARLTSSDQVTTPILYVNSDRTPGYTLNIDTQRTDPILGPRTIFVNGNVVLNGSTVLGSPDDPVALIATGSITCQGSPTIYGVVWAYGTFGGGTPNVTGSIIANNLSGFAGDVTLNYMSFEGTTVFPPDIVYDDTYTWDLAAWEMI